MNQGYKILKIVCELHHTAPQSARQLPSAVNILKPFAGFLKLRGPIIKQSIDSRISEQPPVVGFWCNRPQLPPTFTKGSFHIVLSNAEEP